VLKPISLYLHVPFCSKRCDYCHFYVVTGLNNLIPEYVARLVEEIKAAAAALSEYQVQTIYIGGGTPSLLSPEQLETILATTREQLGVAQNLEITLETNPEDIDVVKLKAFYAAGITRLSVGLQAAQDHLLSQMGRTYTREGFATIAGQIKNTGFTNYNFDLIFGLPHQTLTDWEDSLDFALSFNPTHLSCYSLELDHQSVFGQKYRKGLLIPPNDAENRACYTLAQEKLATAGFTQYELSNWSKPDFECHHNVNFWHNQPYYGFGAGAHSFFENKTWSNVPIVKKYLAADFSHKTQQQSIEVISKKQQIEESVVLGLRLINGIAIPEWEKRYGVSFRETFESALPLLQNQNLITLTKNQVKLTAKGKDLFDTVAAELLRSVQQ
jgi:oxygen-independent coproporphyrinogen-3 oxidase